MHKMGSDLLNPQNNQQRLQQQQNKSTSQLNEQRNRSDFDTADQLKTFIMNNQQALSKVSLNEHISRMTTSSQRINEGTSAAAEGHKRQTSNWQKLIKQINKISLQELHTQAAEAKAKRQKDSLQELGKGDKNEVHQHSTIQNFLPSFNRSYLKESSGSENMMINNTRTAAGQLNSLNGGIAKIVMNTGYYGSMSPARKIKSREEQSPSAMNVQIEAVAARSMIDKNSSHSIDQLQNQKPTLYYPMAIPKGEERTSTNIERYQSTEMLLQDDGYTEEVDNTDGDDGQVLIEQKRWKQVPIREQDSSKLSQKSSSAKSSLDSRQKYFLNRRSWPERRLRTKRKQSTEQSQIEERPQPTENVESEAVSKLNHQLGITSYDSSQKFRSTVFQRTTSVSKETEDAAVIASQDADTVKDHVVNNVKVSKKADAKKKSSVDQQLSLRQIRHQQKLIKSNTSRSLAVGGSVGVTSIANKSENSLQKANQGKKPSKLLKKQVIPKEKVLPVSPKTIQLDLQQFKKQLNSPKLNQRYIVKDTVPATLLPSLPSNIKSANKKKRNHHHIQVSPQFGGGARAATTYAGGSLNPQKQKPAAKKTSKVVKNEPKKAKQIFSGWSTDRNSIRTESAVELFENSVLVKNIATAAVEAQHRAQETDRLIYDEPEEQIMSNMKPKQFHKIEKTNKQSQDLNAVMQARGANNNSASPQLMSQVIISRQSFEAGLPSAKKNEHQLLLIGAPVLKSKKQTCTRPNSGRARGKNLTMSQQYQDNQQISLKDRISLVVSKVGNYQQFSTPNIREKVNSRKTPPIKADSSDGGDGNSSCYNAPSTTEILLSRHATNSKILPACDRSYRDLDSHHQNDMLEYMQPAQPSLQKPQKKISVQRRHQVFTKKSSLKVIQTPSMGNTPKMEQQSPSVSNYGTL